MSYDWLMPHCQRKEPVEEFRNSGPGDWVTDADLTEASGEPCNMEDVHVEVEESA